MSKVLNLDGTQARTSRQPPGYPEAPPGYEYRNPDPACPDMNCSGGCWAIRKPESVSDEQFARDMTLWKLHT